MSSPDATFISSENSSSDSDGDDPDWSLPRAPPKHRPADLSLVAEAVDATDIGARAASKVLSAYAAKAGETAITKKRLQNALNLSREQKVVKVADDAAPCVAVFSDGRDDLTRDGKRHNISVNMHPGDVLIGHFSCDTHTGAEVAEKLIAFLSERGVDIDKVVVVGGDGTNQVTGWRGGWMAVMEQTIGRPLGRVVCLLHQAELAYRALFCHLDGVTAGPKAWTGPVGKAICTEVHLLPVTSFARIPCEDFPSPSDHVKFSSDCQLLFDCARAVVTGDASAVANKTHGKLHHARWHTAQSRLLRYYMSVPEPSAPLVKLATYVACIYVPCVVKIRTQWDLVHAPRHLTEQVRRQRHYLSGDDLQVAQKSVAHNAYMAHPENVLLAMLGDEDPVVRQEAVQLIRRMRDRRSAGLVRRFRRPEIRLEAEHYTELVDVHAAADDADVEPPYCGLLSDADLEQCLEAPLVTGIPCNTQSTERAVRSTTESVARVSGARRQDGCSLNKGAFRRLCPSQVTSSTFKRFCE